MTNSTRALVAALLLLFSAFGGAPDAAARVGDRDTLRVPAARAQLVEDLLRDTAAVDRVAVAEELRAAEEAERQAALAAAQRREAELRAAAVAAAERREAELRAAAEAARRDREAQAQAAAAPPDVEVDVEADAAAAAEAGEGGVDAAASETGAAAARGVPSAVERELPPLPAPGAPVGAGALPAAGPRAQPRPGSRAATQEAPAAGGGAAGAKGSAPLAIGAEARVGVAVGAVLLVGAWLLRRRRRRRRGAAHAVPAQLRTLGKVALGNRWQVTLLELPDEVLVLGAGEGGVQVLTRISDPARVAALRQAHEEGGRGFGRLLRGLLDRPADGPATPAFAVPADAPQGRPATDDDGDDLPAPADILAAERAFELHRALGGGLSRRPDPLPPTALRPSPNALRPSSDETREVLELELMKQRLADLRAGRFAQ